MKIEYGIQPNCSECAIVVYKDKVTPEQEAIFKRYCTNKGIKVITTPKGNSAIEIGYDTFPDGKADLWSVVEAIEDISGWEGKQMTREVHFDAIRDESWYDMLDSGGI